MSRSTTARPSDDELLDGALAVFAERGFAAATMAAVAARCGSTKPTLYAHFTSKEGLVARLLEREAEVCRSMLVAAYDAHAGLSLREQVAGDVRALFDYAAAHPEAFALLLGVDHTPAVVATQTRLLEDVDAHIARRVHDYLEPDSGTEPSSTEQQLAAIIAGVAVQAARYALVHDSGMDRACDLATAFLTAALRGLDAARQA